MPRPLPLARTTDATEHAADVDTAGHVFVVKGVLESVAADVLIVPSSGRFVPRRTWWPALEITEEPRPATGAGRARRFASSGVAVRPAWIFNVAHDGRQSVPWLLEGLKDALDKIRHEPPSTGDGRVRPLIAMPTLGVGLGGYEGVRGKVIQSLLEQTSDFVAESDFDIVVVVENAADYAAFQSVRRERGNSTPQRKLAQKLAETIRADDVALLLGAGVSVPAGLPSWDQLLTMIKETTLPELDDSKFAEMNVLDRAQLLSKSSGTSSLGARAALITGAGATKSPTLAHCLLASLGVRKAVTTNYDTLYEDAFESAHGPHSISVLPRQEAHSDRSWLLKMHGDVADPESIILSRRDFVRYDSQRRPLASIVQSLMATSHLIVIGASMTDDNVLRLAHEVLAMNATNGQERALGTIVTLRRDDLRAALWKGDFHFVAASKSSSDSVAARDLEIMLDGVAMYASDRSPFLLDVRYGELLDGKENVIAGKLREVAGQIRAIGSRDRRHRWEPLQKTLVSMGEVEQPGRVIDRTRVAFDDLIEAYFSAAEHQKHVAVLSGYHNQRRDILADLFECHLLQEQSRSWGPHADDDRNAVVGTASRCLQQASALSGPFSLLLEGAPGPLEKQLYDLEKRRFDHANDALRQEYRQVFAEALRLLYPGIDELTFRRSLLIERGLPNEEPSDPWGFD